MNLAEATLILTAIGLLFAGYVTGLFMGAVRTSEPATPKYLRFAHTAAYMQAPILLGVVVALQFSGMSDGFDAATAIVVSAAAVMLVLKDVVNWRMGVADEFRDRGTGYRIGVVFGFVHVAGLVMLTVAVISGV